jgi:hypothetical protein
MRVLQKKAIVSSLQHFEEENASLAIIRSLSAGRQNLQYFLLFASVVTGITTNLDLVYIGRKIGREKVGVFVYRVGGG